jgi:dienelactone hydrolase
VPFDVVRFVARPAFARVAAAALVSWMTALCGVHAWAASGAAAGARPAVVRSSLSWHWLAHGRLWYTIDTGPNAMEWVLVEPDGALARFTDRAALEAALRQDLGAKPPMRLMSRPETRTVTGRQVELVFRNLTAGEVSLSWLSPAGPVFYATVGAGKQFAQPTYTGHAWQVRDAQARTLGYVTAQELESTVVIDPAALPQPQSGPAPARDPGTSPDGAWIAFIRGHDVWARPATGVGAEIRLSTDGAAGNSYAGTRFFWSPDSSRLVAFRTQPAQEHKLDLVSTALDEGGKPLAVSFDYLVPGDRIAHPRPVLFDLARRTARVVADAAFPSPYSLLALDGAAEGDGVTWAADSSRFFFAYNQRGHQLMRVIAVDGASAKAATLFEDTSRTFIDYSGKYWGRYLARTNEILWMSERDGWNHLYVHDAASGAMKRRLTRGAWLVRRIEDLDERSGTLIARVAGRNRGQDPYHDHFVRIALDDGAITPLTEADGTHEIVLSPDRSRYLDVYSRVDLPPVFELRRGSDGKRLAVLEKADAGALLAAGWQPPERFVAKGRDGRTDIWGIVLRPSDFDPSRRYPVIEKIYAGPQGYAVPKHWSPEYGDAQQLADRGFVVVQIDGMGTNGRGRAFHDVAYKNLKDAGFPDRIAWMKALAAKYPKNLDLGRVGIYGDSAGGQNAVAALLWHGDFYKVAVADSGCHDNRMDKLWWNEQWMGYPVDRSYEDSSNIVHAAQLRGKLLLTVGDLDVNVDPASTLRLAHALAEAGKPYELVVFPGAGHGAIESPEGQRRRIEFFVKELARP